MANTSFFLVSDDPELVRKAQEFWQSYGVQVQVFSPQQWNNGLEDPSFRQRVKLGVPALSMGANPLDAQGAKVLQFPTQEVQQSQRTHTEANYNTQPIPLSSVSTINEMESVAIQNAIDSFNGNLTEAAKALGIGRATLYRKVKRYKIDPGEARRRKTAA